MKMLSLVATYPTRRWASFVKRLPLNTLYRFCTEDAYSGLVLFLIARCFRATTLNNVYAKKFCIKTTTFDIKVMLI